LERVTRGCSIGSPGGIEGALVSLIRSPGRTRKSHRGNWEGGMAGLARGHEILARAPWGLGRGLRGIQERAPGKPKNGPERCPGKNPWQAWGHFMLIQGPRYTEVFQYMYQTCNLVTIQVQYLNEYSKNIKNIPRDSKLLVLINFCTFLCLFGAKSLQMLVS